MRDLRKLKENFIKKSEELDYLMKKAEKSLAKAPEGSLVISSSRGYPHYYHKKENDKNKGNYIPAKKKRLIRALAQKDYDQQFLKNAKKQKAIIQKIIKLISTLKSIEIYSELSDIRRNLVNPYLLTDEQYIERCMYRTNRKKYSV